MSLKLRVRFSPAPTGFMHLGNVRTALMNYLFARQKDGTFVLRIEDTDPQRNLDPQAATIIADLQWLGLDYDEGPIKEGPYAPYFQSQRTEIYKEKLYLLPERFRKRADNESIERIVCDYIAGMTDRFAIQEFEKFSK